MARPPGVDAKEIAGLKNIQVGDGAENSTYSIFLANCAAGGKTITRE